MRKQIQAVAAVLMVSSLPMMAQSSQTDVVKVAPGQKKTTVIHRRNGATDTVISEGTTGTHRTARRRKAVAHKPVMHREPVESATSRELRELRDKQAAQQAEIDALTQANAAKDAALVQAQTAASGAEAQAQAATAASQSVSSSVQANTDAVQQLKSNVTDLANINAGLATTISANKTELKDEIENPLAIHYKGVTITPTGFFALEGVYRTRSINSDINTPFNTTPYPGSNEGHVSEFNLSGRQSRLGGLFQGDTGRVKLTGFFETDFLSAAATSNANQSNSYSLRVRQIWGKAETKSGFAVTAGQTWTLATENGKGTDARTEKLPNTIDPQYMVGYTWARQPGIRFQQKIGNPLLGAATTIAVSVENAQTQGTFSASTPNNFIFGGPGTAGGVYNVAGNYANSVSPDGLAKIAFDGKHVHTEIGGLVRFFRDELYPITITQNAAGVVTTTFAPTLVKNTKIGGGAFGSVRGTSRFADVALAGMFGDGTGRYGSSQLGDVTAHPDGTLALIHNYHGLFSLETHPSKKLDVYAYYGAEYNQRTTYVTPITGTLVGYGVRNAVDSGCFVNTPPTPGTGGTGVTGSPTAANCASPTRIIQEGTIGYTYKLIDNPRYGILRYQFTYSYLQRSGWSGLQSGTFGTANAVYVNPRATNNLIFGGLRYYIP